MSHAILAPRPARRARRAEQAERLRVLRRAARRHRGGGFSLVELMISLVAGLIVAAAVMGVSKEATNSFHEEVRVAGAEMALRVAIERIRADLQRAAFMGTGNLLGDPQVARLANFTGPYPNLSNFGCTAGVPLSCSGIGPYSLSHLTGIALHPQGASVLSNTLGPGAAAQLSLATALGTNAFAPDSIDIGGNFTSSDEYAASVVWKPATAPGACSSAAAISIEMSTPAGWRLRLAEASAATPGTALQSAFHPGTSANPMISSQTSEIIRLTDQSGHSQYLLGCAGTTGTATAFALNGGAPTAMVYLDPKSAILSTNDTGGLGGVGGFGAGWVTVAPVEIARWDIMTPAQLLATSAATAANYMYGQTSSGAAGVAKDPSDYLLTRSYLDVTNGKCASGAPCGIDPVTTEVVAEYAVDLKFGATVDQFICTTLPCPGVLSAPTYQASPFLPIPMDSLPPSVPATPSSPYVAPSNTFTAGVGPQRIRDMQVRIGIRSQFGDRATTIAPPVGGTFYAYRYQLDNTSPAYRPATPFARVREATTEVTLPNQARFFW